MMKANWSRVFLVLGMLLLLAACNQVINPTLSGETLPQPAATLSIDDTLTQETQTNNTQMTQPAPTSSSSGMQALIEKAKQDLAQRLSVSVDHINLEEAKEAVWPDASLGCPQPGMMYAQVQTAGYFIQLEAKSVSYEYHTGMDNTVILCESTSEEKKLNKDTDKNVQGGWPNQSKDRDVIIVSPTPRK